MLNNREFLQLAKVYDPKRDDIKGWYVSEKLDGMRAFWDGGITRGMFCNDIPFANVAKDDRYLERRKATGLWSRYAKPIYAPDWFLGALPNFPLDGELWMGRGNFQKVMNTVKELTPQDWEWKRIRYKIFDLPSLTNVFSDGRINNPNYQKEFVGLFSWWSSLVKGNRPSVYFFDDVYKYLFERFGTEGNEVSVLQHTLVSDQGIDHILDKVCDHGGEGLMLRAPKSVWAPRRSENLLKVKKYLDSEATVTGFTMGEGKYAGMMGSLQVIWNGKVFNLSGFDDSERQLGFNGTHSIIFPIGSSVTFRYRELTDDGMPKEARYLRKNHE